MIRICENMVSKNLSKSFPISQKTSTIEVYTSIFLYMKYFILFLSLCIFPYDIFADEAPPTTPDIIPRASWGANSEYNNLYSSYWQDILAARAAYVPTSIDLEKQKKNREKQAKINTYLNTHFAQQFQTAQKILFSPNNKKYAWPLKYTDYVDSIVIHHTHSEYADSLTGMRNIHKFHSLSRQW